MPTENTSRFPRIIRLFDRIFAADVAERAFAILSWMGGGFVLVFILPLHLMRQEMSSMLQGNEALAVEVGFKATLSALIGLVLLATFYGAFYYWVFKAGVPRVRAGLGTEYNPIKFGRMAGMLREIQEWRDATDWRKYEIPRHAAAVQAYESWLSTKDADSYKAWRAYRVEQGV